jgi:hypothetical protein
VAAKHHPTHVEVRRENIVVKKDCTLDLKFLNCSLVADSLVVNEGVTLTFDATGLGATPVYLLIKCDNTAEIFGKLKTKGIDDFNVKITSKLIKIPGKIELDACINTANLTSKEIELKDSTFDAGYLQKTNLCFNSPKICIHNAKFFTDATSKTLRVYEDRVQKLAEKFRIIKYKLITDMNRETASSTIQKFDNELYIDKTVFFSCLKKLDLAILNTVFAADVLLGSKE